MNDERQRGNQQPALQNISIVIALQPGDDYLAQSLRRNSRANRCRGDADNR